MPIAYQPSRGTLAQASPQQALRGLVSRPAVSGAIGAAVEAGRVTVVVAPSGFGKSVAVSDWARQASIPVAWLSLSRFDSDPVRLLAGVVRALQAAAAATEDPAYLELLALDANSTDIAAGYEALTRALGGLEAPIALVVDDLHRAGEAVDDGIIGALVDKSPATLRLVLVSRELPRLPLERHELHGEATVLGPPLLRFDAGDVELAARELGRDLDPAAAAKVAQATDGWPAAVRLTLLSASGAIPGPSLVDFVSEEILAPLPEQIREFVLAATTYAELTAASAVEITGQQDAAALLEECVRRGLFLDRFGDGSTAPSYRWHSIFAAQCRAVQVRLNPERALELHVRVARALASTEPLVAIDEAIKGNDPSLAVEILKESWIGIVVGTGGGVALDMACAALPQPWGSHPEILLIRACCMDLQGDRPEAQRMLQRASARIDAEENGADAERDRNVAALFLTDDHARLRAIADQVHEDLTTLTTAGPRRVGTLLVLGLTELRLRSRSTLAVRTLEAAAREATATGDEAIARRAAGQLAFVLAFGGEFDAAQNVLEGIRDLSTEVGGWYTYIGGAEDAAAGWIAYWRGDFITSEIHFRRVIDSGTGPTSFAGIARMYLAFIAAAVGDRAQRSEATEMLRGLPNEDTHGVPWPAYRLVSLAKLAEADDRKDRALTIARRFKHVEHIPATGVVIAELLRRAGDDRWAVALLEQLRTTGGAAYVRVSAMVTMAMIHRGRGNASVSHELFEQALELAVPRGIRRPFIDDEPTLRALMLEHAAWGTRYEEFLASASESPHHLDELLSGREREILGYLRTTMTANEIAAALGVSINTIKTHLRGVYRKLGVASRREAVRIRG